MKFVKVLILIHLILCLVAPIVAGADEAAPEEPMDISTFDAVILESKGHIDHMYTTTMGKETFTTKIKYLTAKGIEDYGYVELEYDPSEENIGDIEGKVTLPDGKEIKITKDHIFKKKIVKRGRYKRTQIKIVFPALEEGAVAEYSYFRSFDLLDWVCYWAFQHELPTLHSELSFTPYSRLQWGCSMPRSIKDPETDENRKGGNRTLVFTRKNIPALPRESYSLGYNALREAITFYYQSRDLKYKDFWSDGLKTTYEKLWEEFMEPCSKAKAIGKSQMSSLKEGEDIILKLYESSKRRFISMDMMTHKEKNEEKIDEKYLKKLYEYEDSGDIYDFKYVSDWMATYGLASLINSTVKDAKVELVLYIPWTEDIFDFNLKSHQQFYERILKVTYKDKVYWLSPGSRYFPANMMDFAAKGVRVAVVNEDGASLEKIPLDEYTDNMSSRVATVTFDPDEGTATIDVTNAYNPYQSYYKRSSLLYFDTDAERKESIEEDLKDDFGDETVLNSISFENLDDIHKPVIITMSYTINYEFEELGDQIIMDFPGFNSPKTNPFLDQDRHSNIFFNYPYEKTQEVTYKIPEGFSIVSVPENAKVRSQVISFKVDYEKISDTELKVKSTETLKRNMMSNSAVKMLKRKYNKIVEIRRNKVVLQEL